MNDGVFGANSGQKKALGNENEGVFDTNSGARKATGGLQKVDNGKGSALARHVKEGAGKLAAVVAAGKDIQMDAQRVMFFLSTYGEGDKLGRFVFTSVELVGKSAYKEEIEDVTYVGEKDDPNDTRTAFEKASGSGVQTKGKVTVERPAILPTDDGEKLDMSGIRLRDAVHLLRDRGWVETTEDGEFGQDCDFSTVKLTASGRELALRSVKQQMKKGGFEDAGFAGMPDLFDLDGGFGGGSAPQLTELQQQQTMLSRAHVPYTVEHSGEDDDARTTILINGKPSFVFDSKGSLVNAAKDANEVNEEDGD